MQDKIIIRKLGLQSYPDSFSAMRTFTENRAQDTNDELWVLQHPPVFTQGQAGKPEHILNAGNIPIIQSDRGGQVTYHGAGQLIVYFMLDIQRRNLGIRSFVRTIEQSVIELLSDYELCASTKKGAPGVYVEESKICSLGLRIRKGCSYHGLALNVDMDLEPFQRINPCGFKDMKVVQIKDFHPHISLEEVSKKLISHLARNLNYTEIVEKEPIFADSIGAVSLEY